MVAKPHPVSIAERLLEIERNAKKEHITDLEQMMDKFMMQHKKEIVRHVFADYSEDFKELAKEFDKLKKELEIMEMDLPDAGATAEKSEIKEECSNHCSDASESAGQCVPPASYTE